MGARTHLDVLGAIDPATRAALQTRSDAAGLIHLAGHASLIGLFTCWIAFAWPLWQIALLGQGLALVFLFTLQHECTHDTPFSSKRINSMVGHVCGLILIQPFNWFRCFHLAHHKHTNDPANDPELLSGAKPQTWRQMIVHVSGLPLWFAMVKITVQNAIAPKPQPYLAARAHARLKHEARIMIALYGVVIASLLWIHAALWLWIIPALLGQPFLRLYLLAEHGRCPPVANMLENTRTTFTNRAVRFLAWNMPYHIEHHSAPNVPFHRLPDLHRIMSDDLITTSSGYTEFTRDYAAHLK